MRSLGVSKERFKEHEFNLVSQNSIRNIIFNLKKDLASILGRDSVNRTELIKEAQTGGMRFKHNQLENAFCF